MTNLAYIIAAYSWGIVGISLMMYAVRRQRLKLEAILTHLESAL